MCKTSQTAMMERHRNSTPLVCLFLICLSLSLGLSNSFQLGAKACGTRDLHPCRQFPWQTTRRRTTSTVLLSTATQTDSRKLLTVDDENGVSLPAVFDRRNRPWMESYAVLRKYKDQYGHCQVKPNHDATLNRWVNLQRHQQDSLSEKKRKLLDEVGFDWMSRKERRKQHWRARFQQYVEDPSTNECRTWANIQRDLNKKGLLASHREEKLSKIGFCWSKRTQNAKTKSVNAQKWDKQFAKLAAYQKHFGHCLVPTRYPEDPSLGSWVQVQRVNRNKLLDDRKERLDSIGFAWKVDKTSELALNRTGLPCDRRWEKQFEKLMDYQARYGDCLVPPRYPEDPSLGTWVTYQRTHHHRLLDRRKKRLDSIGFVWRLNGIPEAMKSRSMNVANSRWDEQFSKLVDFQTKHGHCLVPTVYPEDPSLGFWVKRQRSNRHGLRDDRKRQLDSIGFAWRFDHGSATAISRTEGLRERRWEEQFAKVADFQARFGHCHIPKVYNEDPSLGRWAHAQRLNRDSYLDRRRRRLDDLGFSWGLDQSTNTKTVKKSSTSLSDHRWEQQFKKLVDFKSCHGHCLVPTQHVEDPALGSWVSKQRRRRHSLPGSRKRQLDSIGFAWEFDKASGQAKSRKGTLADRQWEQQFAKLSKFQARYGHCLVPQLYPDDPSLGRWVRYQRQQRHRVPEHRKLQLDSIGFSWRVRGNSDY